MSEFGPKFAVEETNKEDSVPAEQSETNKEMPTVLVDVDNYISFLNGESSKQTSFKDKIKAGVTLLNRLKGSQLNGNISEEQMNHNTDRLVYELTYVVKGEQTTPMSGKQVEAIANDINEAFNGTLPQIHEKIYQLINEFSLSKIVTIPS